MASNKKFKDFVQKFYLRYSTEFIRSEQAKTPNEPNRHIKMVISIVRMMEIIEEAVKLFNAGQCELSSIEKTFILVRQHP